MFKVMLSSDWKTKRDLRMGKKRKYICWFFFSPDLCLWPWSDDENVEFHYLLCNLRVFKTRKEIWGYHELDLFFYSAIKFEWDKEEYFYCRIWINKCRNKDVYWIAPSRKYHTVILMAGKYHKKVLNKISSEIQYKWRNKTAYWEHQKKTSIKWFKFSSPNMKHTKIKCLMIK